MMAATFPIPWARALALAVAVLPALAGAQDYAGLVQPLHDITLSTGVGGVVANRLVRPGSKVGAGQVLMVMDDRVQAVEADRRKVILDDSSELRATQERSRIARTLYEDARRVYDRTGAISRDELMRLEAESVAAAGRYDQLRAQKEREKLEHQGAVQERQMRQLVAPVGGIVTKVDIEVGEWAKPGEPLVRLVDASTLVFKGNLPMAAVQPLRPGLQVPIVVEDGGRPVPVLAKVSFVSPVADAASGLVEVRADIPNPGNRLRPGSRAVLRMGAMASPASLARQP
ncbi:MAG: efflux RND transporter periplasmic adaptor subunit [Comamonadaceae bacterium]|nr:MAG: efflux RND transporter periplasmic adaptor subunit [Comamonadaceae bacterium]